MPQDAPIRGLGHHTITLPPLSLPAVAVHEIPPLKATLGTAIPLIIGPGRPTAGTAASHWVTSLQTGQH
ncbi:MAG: hypothetical protein KJZ78_21875, partial [Bryobacteraceae bacterium]|nr:hypothetical protein [Bryobacteraceae bacterium]